MEKLKNTLSLSEITIGTMRFFDKSLSSNEVGNIIEKAFDIGINTHHTSYEYNSYELYKEALKTTTCKQKIKHIAKLSAPHFEDSVFSSKILENRVDKVLEDLQIETIDVLQWLLRSKPINDSTRLETLSNFKEEIEECLFQLKRKGKIKSAFSFPYSTLFAKEVFKFDQIDGIVSYLNKEEKEYNNLANTNPFIAIRPFFAGKLLNTIKGDKEKIIRSCLNYVKEHKSVITTIVSINSIEQLDSFKNLTN